MGEIPERQRTGKCDLSVVIPCFNEEASLETTVRSIKKYIQQLTEDYEIIIIDDGSLDNTFHVIRRLRAQDERIHGMRFTRNFGKEAAIYAGLRTSRGAGILLLDADSQHPPALLLEMVKHWRGGGFQIVEAVKTYGGKGSLFSRFRSKVFNSIMSRFTGLEMEGASDFKLLDRRAADIIIRLSESNRLFRGLTKWTGMRTKQIFFEVPERIAGKSQWSVFGLIKLSISAITAFSFVPLQMITTLGGLTLFMSFILIMQTLYNKLSGHAVSGFATVIILNLILSSIVMICLGIIGMYLANVYAELKRRPAYLIAETTDGIVRTQWDDFAVFEENPKIAGEKFSINESNAENLPCWSMVDDNSDRSDGLK
jgi:polyisoprenyl-phosphate glycosyltransferase